MRLAATECTDLPPGDLPAHTGAAGGDKALVTRHSVSPAGQDQRQGRRQRPPDCRPDVRVYGVARVVPADCCGDCRGASLTIADRMSAAAGIGRAGRKHHEACV